MKIVSLLAIAELGLTFAFAPLIEARAADADAGTRPFGCRAVARSVSTVKRS